VPFDGRPGLGVMIRNPLKGREDMNTRILISMLVIAGLAAAPGHADAAGDVQLSPDLLNLLRAEMREISAGVQAMALALATADWKSIQETGAKIRASYILEKNLTPAQAAELGEALPEQFRLLDAQFHQRAEKAGAAAAAHDAELVTFHYARMLESCTACHSEFAKSRFPAFSPATYPDHHH
jgi:hypothetical protein